ncbi:MAG: hypothetical protein P4L99_30525 [Chthoniobacter sp.]|nr:hypothetical protein [Chthoniobacter sp.]
MKSSASLFTFTIFGVFCVFFINTVSTAHAADGNPDAVTKVPVVFSGGHETDGRDRGRPVVLVAGALGVPPEVFREAFSHVHPAGPDSGGPSQEEARANKAALMSALGKYGVTNDRLDTVSNRYRYVRSHNEMWPTAPAVANALVQNGVVTGYEIVSGGFGYSSPPTVSVPNVKTAPAKVELSFTKDFETNGAVSKITVATGADK